MDKALLNFYRERDFDSQRIVMSTLEKLAKKHIYFEFLRLDWQSRLRFHDLRHTFSTQALQNGVDIKTVSVCWVTIQQGSPLTPTPTSPPPRRKRLPGQWTTYYPAAFRSAWSFPRIGQRIGLRRGTSLPGAVGMGRAGSPYRNAPAARQDSGRLFLFGALAKHPPWFYQGRIKKPRVIRPPWYNQDG